MLNKEQIEIVAQWAAYVSYNVLGMSPPYCKYTVEIIDDPSYEQDGLLDTQENIISINLATLKPFEPEAIVSPESISSLSQTKKTSVDANTDKKTEMNKKDRLADENYRHILKICVIVFHEMRHLYQLLSVKIYKYNKQMGGKVVKPLESDKKCELWLRELEAYTLDESVGTDIEEDADDFAYYLSNRYPTKLPMLCTNRRIGNFKRKYDKVPIPETKGKPVNASEY